MQLGLVVGTVVASVKADGMEGVKLLIVQPLDKQQQPTGRAVIAADAVQMAGPGEIVYPEENKFVHFDPDGSERLH